MYDSTTHVVNSTKNLGSLTLLSAPRGLNRIVTPNSAPITATYEVGPKAYRLSNAPSPSSRARPSVIAASTGHSSRRAKRLGSGGAGAGRARVRLIPIVNPLRCDRARETSGPTAFARADRTS